MSAEISVQFEVRDIEIMKNTLKEMSIDFNEVNKGILSIDRSYHNIVINGNTGDISFDEENQKEIDLITQNYQTAWYKQQLIREGVAFTEEKIDNVVYLYAEN